MSIDWRQQDECHPFLDDVGNICITVDSAYVSPGDEKEKRLAEARYDGVFKLLKFYGKDTKSSTIDGLDRVARVDDYFVSYKPCVPMKVLVKF